ncbi:hypothetical protein [Nocardioides solisilvae]|uniref:hypothetical protein n=1 Tax=Nocardioides solisilvae TaxID=1542435 RepID=UPI000D74BF83|nr:hypothetical protein [Nocardioides solisilvae]
MSGDERTGDRPPGDDLNPGRDPGAVDPDVAEVLQGSNPSAGGDDRLAGGMGLSSERVGHAGPGQEATDGLRDVAPHPVDPADAPPEQSAGGEEPKPVGIPPKQAPDADDVGR